MVALFLFLKGMTGALAPFSYLVFTYFGERPNISQTIFPINLRLFPQLSQ
jgi:hypothetical protein